MGSGLGLGLGLELGLGLGGSPGMKSTRTLTVSVCMEIGSESLNSVRNLWSRLRNLLGSVCLKHGP